MNTGDEKAVQRNGNGNGNGKLVLTQIAQLLVILGSIFGASFWIEQEISGLHLEIAKNFHHVDSRINSMEYKIQHLPAVIDIDGWTGRDQLIWSLQLEKQNRELSVPDPRKTRNSK